MLNEIWSTKKELDWKFCHLFNPKFWCFLTENVCLRQFLSYFIEKHLGILIENLVLPYMPKNQTPSSFFDWDMNFDFKCHKTMLGDLKHVLKVVKIKSIFSLKEVIIKPLTERLTKDTFKNILPSIQEISPLSCYFPSPRFYLPFNK